MKKFKQKFQIKNSNRNKFQIKNSKFQSIVDLEFGIFDLEFSILN